jgi:large conductance mechanosensitive channel
MVKIINKIRDEESKPAAPTPEEILLLREIRDGLKKNKESAY